MKKITVIAPMLAVSVLLMVAQVVRGEASALAIAGARYGVTEIQTAGTTHNTTAYTLGPRAGGDWDRFVFRVTQRPATAANTAAFALNPSGGAAYTLFTLPAATHDQTQVAKLTAQVAFQVGSTNVATPNTIGVILRPGDLLSITGTTNSVVRYRLEYFDVPRYR